MKKKSSVRFLFFFVLCFFLIQFLLSPFFVVSSSNKKEDYTPNIFTSLFAFSVIFFFNSELYSPPYLSIYSPILVCLPFCKPFKPLNTQSSMILS